MPGRYGGIWSRPNAVLELIREIPNLTCLLGNHDVAVIGRIPFEAFNGDARRTLEYHERVLTADNMDFLRSLSSNLKVREDASLVHGSPRDSVWEYILNTLSARLNFDHFTTPWCFVGHSHLQCMFQLDEKTDRVNLKPIKVGRAGQTGAKADRQSRVRWASRVTATRARPMPFTTAPPKTWEPRRVAYNIPEVQKRIREARSARKTCGENCGGVVGTTGQLQ